MLVINRIVLGHSRLNDGAMKLFLRFDIRFALATDDYSAPPKTNLDRGGPQEPDSH